MTKIYNVLCRVVFFLFPLVFILPQQFSRNLYHSIPFWIVVSSGLILLPLAHQSIKKIGSQAILLILSIYVTSLVIVTLFSTSISTSLPILFLNSAYFVIFLTSSKVVSSQKGKELLVLIFLIVTTFLSAVSFYNTSVKGYANLTSEGLSFMWVYFGHNHLAALLIIAIPLCLYFFWFSTLKILKVLFALLLFFFLYSFLVSSSRGAILALLLGMFFALIIFKRPYQTKIKYKMVIVLGMLVLCLVISLFLMINKKSLASVYSRLRYVQKGSEMFIQKPIIGYGLGTFNQAKIDSYSMNKGAFYPHNMLIQSLAEGGVILFSSTTTLFLFLAASSVSKINKIKQFRPLLFYIFFWIAFVGLLINEMVDFDLQLPSIGALFWLIAGWIIFRNP